MRLRARSRGCCEGCNGIGDRVRLACTARRPLSIATYKAFAWESVPQSAWFNADFIQKYDSRGQSITLDRGANVALQLTFIPREPDPQ